MTDDRSFDAFYQASSARLVGQMLAVTGDLATAEDVVQEAFVRAAIRWSRIRDYDNPEAWVRRVAVNLARSEVRRGMRLVAALVRHGPPGEITAVDADDLATLQALRALPHRYREVVVLHHLLELPVEEIASMLSTPAGTVRSRLARGRRRLAELLADPANDPLADQPVINGGTA
jgi:RNA polymerase sigma-70 factor (ECF subfamily)